MEMEKPKHDFDSEKYTAHKPQVTSGEETPKPASWRAHRMTRVLFALVLLAVMAGLAVSTYSQYHKANKLDNQGHALTAQVKQLKTSNNKLKSANTLLGKSLQTIANEKTKSSSQSPSATTTTTKPSSSASAPAPVPVINLCDVSSSNSTSDGAFTVHGIEGLNPSYFGDAAANATTDHVQAIFVTIKNLASSDQTYSIFNFGAVTSTGTVIKPRVYAGPGTGTIWNNSVLAAGESTCQALLFDTGNTFLALQMTPPGSTDTYTLPLPSIAN
jgi:Tfp pilus assembly protein FimT